MNTLNLLLNHAIKPSVQRLAVMEYLQTHLTHPTVEDIYLDLLPTMPTLSRTTVYNTLKLFEDHGVVSHIGIDSRNARFDGNTVPHNHFRCKGCGTIMDVWDSRGVNSSPDIPNDQDFTITEIHVYYKGYCKNCRENLVTTKIAN